MDIQQIIEYWAGTEVRLYTYKPSQLDNLPLSKATINFLVNCGLPDSCAPGLSFDNCNASTIPTPNQIFDIDIDIEELNDFLMIGSNGSGDPICIDLKNENEIVYLNHDNGFERIHMNSSIHQFTECVIRYREFHDSLDPRFENNIFLKRKFLDEEFSRVCNDFMKIDDKSLWNNSCWKAELDLLLWERDNE